MDLPKINSDLDDVTSDVRTLSRGKQSTQMINICLNDLQDNKEGTNDYDEKYYIKPNDQKNNSFIEKIIHG